MLALTPSNPSELGYQVPPNARHMIPRCEITLRAVCIIAFVKIWNGRFLGNIACVWWNGAGLSS